MRRQGTGWERPPRGWRWAWLSALERHLRHELHILPEAAQVVGCHITGGAVLDLAWRVRERVPDREALPAVLPAALNLIGGRGGPPRKRGGKGDDLSRGLWSRHSLLACDLAAVAAAAESRARCYARAARGAGGARRCGRQTDIPRRRCQRTTFETRAVPSDDVWRVRCSRERISGFR